MSAGDRDSVMLVNDADVGEHHAGLDVLAAHRQPGRQELLRHLGGRELPEQRPLLVAESLLLQAGADAGLQQYRVQRLEEVVLGAHLDAAGDAVHLFHRRHHHDREVAEARVRGQGLQHLVAVHLGHLDVEQDQIDRALAQDTQGLDPVLGERDRVPQLLERAPEEQPVHPVVIHHQEVAGRGLREEVTSELSQGARGRLVPGDEWLDSIRRSLQAPAPGHRLELARQGRELRGAEALAVGLERMGGPAEGIDIILGQGPSQRGDQLSGVLDECVDQLARRTDRPSSP